MIEAMREGDARAAEEFLFHVYHEWRTLAACKMAHEAPGQTLQPTALVHEAWLRLGIGEGARFPSRAYFFAAAGEAMRRILVEAARRKKRLKHGGNLERVDIEHVELAAPLPDDELLALDEALTRFAESEPRAAELVKLLFFVGLTQEQAAKELGVPLRTYGDWKGGQHAPRGFALKQLREKLKASARHSNDELTDGGCVKKP